MLASRDPQTLALMWPGRQSAERERISEINWSVFQTVDYCAYSAGKRISITSWMVDYSLIADSFELPFSLLEIYVLKEWFFL